MAEDRAEDIALFDLDSSLANYSKAMKHFWDKIKGPNEPEFQDYIKNMPEYLKQRKYLIRDQPGWWKHLEPLKAGFDILNIARKLGFKIYILTGASKKHPMSWMEKVQWVKKHVPDAMIHITEDKSQVYGKVLVDDYPPYIKGWLNHRKRGLVIIPAQSWNKDFTHSNAIRYNGTNLDKVKKALEIAKKRPQREPLDLGNL